MRSELHVLLCMALIFVIASVKSDSVVISIGPEQSGNAVVMLGWENDYGFGFSSSFSTSSYKEYFRETLTVEYYRTEDLIANSKDKPYKIDTISNTNRDQYKFDVKCKRCVLMNAGDFSSLLQKRSKSNLKILVLDKKIPQRAKSSKFA